MQVRHFYLAAAGLGTLIPWFFFASFFAEHGLAPGLFLNALFVNGAASGFSSDVLISILVFWVWATLDARCLGVRRWWLIFPAGCSVGLSLALPLYLYLRETASAAVQKQP